MPGLPMITSLFFLFTDNPDYVMLVSYSFFIIIFFATAYFLLKELNLHFLLQIVFLLFITFAEPLKFLFSYFWTETLFSAFTMLAVLFAVKLIQNDEKNYWLFGCITVALTAFIKMYGILNCSFFVIPFLIHKKKIKDSAVFVMLSAMPVILWYARNKISYGYFTYSHNLFGVFNSYNITRPFKYILFLFGNDKAANVVALILFCVCLTPVVLRLRNFIPDNKNYLIWKSLAIGLIVNFCSIYFLSLVSSFDYLESRLLAPVFIIFFLLLFVSLQIIYELFKGRMQMMERSVLILPVIFFAVNPLFQKNIEYKFNVNYPAEHVLWNELHQKEFVKNSSHFISDLDYTHQIYSGKPQRIILHDYLFLNISFISGITAKGKTPFIILRNNELPYFYFNQYSKILNYKKSNISSKDFTVYEKNN
jgi:hypothetical protein